MLRPKHRTAFAADLSLAALIVIGWLIFPVRTVMAAGVPDTGTPPSQVELQLEVWVNGYTTNLIAPFVELPGGSLAVSRDALDDLELVMPVNGTATAKVRLDTIPGVTYRLDRATQIVHLTVPQGMRKAKVYDATRAGTAIEAGRADYSSLLNYSLFASGTQGLSARSVTGAYGGFNGVNASLDGRFIAPFGTFSQTALVGTIPSYYNSLDPLSVSSTDVRRFDSTFTYVDPNSFMTYKAGDTINGGLAWTRPVRMGGIQVQRNFNARPDIVTQALPSFSGSAAAPSAVDVFVNGVKTYSQQVAAGPFQLSNVPTIGGGEARVVVRDASGKEVETKLPFINAPSLLRPGLFEASAEAGVARYNFGIASNDYGESPIASVSLRTGITDWVTGEAHAEGGLGLANGGAGTVVNVANRAVVSAAVTGSLQDGKTGVQLFGSIVTNVGPVRVHAQTQRAFGDYTDLAIASLRLRPTTADEEARAAAAGVALDLSAYYRPAIARDQITVSLPISFDRSNISATWIRTEPDRGAISQIVSLSYSRPFIAKSSLFATAFANVDEIKNVGVYAGVTMPLGDVSLSASVNSQSAGVTASVDAAKPLGGEPGDWGYRVRDSEGYQANRAAAISYRAEKARLEATIQQDERSVHETAEVSGSIVAMKGGVYMANRIEDGFAVVSAGAPGVRVLAENRFAGETDADGMLLVPNLRSNQKNNISIDPTNLSVSAEVENPNQQVVPAYKSGVSVDFKVRREGSSAIVILKKPNGTYVDVGSNGRLSSGGESFLVGYDGQAFVKNLQPQNTVVVMIDKSECRASFGFQPKLDSQVVIGPVVCE
ncbi:MAG: fimbria/pilus outer membrane usher protein [Hyphomicrobiaceae bacterium]